MQKIKTGVNDADPAENQTPSYSAEVDQMCLIRVINSAGTEFDTLGLSHFFHPSHC